MKQLTPAELAVVQVFAARLNGHIEGPVLPFQTLAAKAQLPPREFAAAFKRLIDNGMLFRGGAFHRSDDDPCILIGEGLMRARRMAKPHTGSTPAMGETSLPE